MTRFAIKIMNKYVSKEHNGNKVEQQVLECTNLCHSTLNFLMCISKGNI